MHQVKALLEALAKIRARDPAEKSVVFSQFTGFLDIVQHHLEVCIASHCMQAYAHIL
jgi:SNF2 family DNA or RNA helicase